MTRPDSIRARKRKPKAPNGTAIIDKDGAIHEFINDIDTGYDESKDCIFVVDAQGQRHEFWDTLGFGSIAFIRSCTR